MVASSFFLVPRHVLGGVGFTAPSDQLNLAAIGAGGKGASDIRNASVNGRERVVALCDVDFSGSAKGSAEAFPDAKLYHDFREMLDKAFSNILGSKEKWETRKAELVAGKKWAEVIY